MLLFTGEEKYVSMWSVPFCVKCCTEPKEPLTSYFSEIFPEIEDSGYDITTESGIAYQQP